MSRANTQKNNILRHLEQFGMITPLDALKQYGCFRLGAVIHTLRHEDGLNIKTTLNKGDAKFAIYSLEPKAEELPDRTVPTLVQEVGIVDVAKTIVSGTDEIHEAEEEDIKKNYEEHMKHDYETKFDKRTSMEKAADAEDPNYKVNRDRVRQEFDLIEETRRALGFGDDDE